MNIIYKEKETVMVHFQFPKLFTYYWSVKINYKLFSNRFHKESIKIHKFNQMEVHINLRVMGLSSIQKVQKKMHIIITFVNSLISRYKILLCILDTNLLCRMPIVLLEFVPLWKYPLIYIRINKITSDNVEYAKEFFILYFQYTI